MIQVEDNSLGPRRKVQQNKDRGPRYNTAAEELATGAKMKFKAQAGRGVPWTPVEKITNPDLK